MKNWIQAAFLVAVVAASFGNLVAQVSEEEAGKRFSFGFRVRGFDSDVLSDNTVETSNTTSKTSQSSTTTTSPRRLSVGPALEVNLNRKFAVLVEAFYHRPSYTKVAKNYTGIDDTSTESDERTLKSTVTERTRATYWDVPVLVRYRAFKREGILSKTFVQGGVVLRNVSKIATGTETEFSDGTTAYNENPAAPAFRSVLGVVAGAGLRFVDNFNIKVTPQVRYTHWSRASFVSDSTQSRRNQLEIGIGLVF
jgi:hypothetical protein